MAKIESWLKHVCRQIKHVFIKKVTLVRNGW